MIAICQIWNTFPLASPCASAYGSPTDWERDLSCIMVVSETHHRSLLRAGALALLLAGLSSCQTDDFKPAGGAGAAPAAAAVSDAGLYNQTLGSGSVKVAYLGVRRADQPSRQADTEFRDGAAWPSIRWAPTSCGSQCWRRREKPEAIEAAAKTLAWRAGVPDHHDGTAARSSRRSARSWWLAGPDDRVSDE